MIMKHLTCQNTHRHKCMSIHVCILSIRILCTTLFHTSKSTTCTLEQKICDSPHSNREQFHSTQQLYPCACLLWQLKAHYNLHNNLPLTPILIQINPHHALLPYLHRIHINFIIPCTLMSSHRLLHLGFVNKILNAILIPPMCTWMHHPENYKV
jgi:hypothetical protein